MKANESLYMPLEEKRRLLTDLPVTFRGDRNHMPDGQGAAQMRRKVDASHRADGDPSQHEGWAQLSAETQTLIANDFTEWQAWVSVHGHTGELN